MIERSRFDRRAAAQERGLETDPEIHQEMCKCSTNIAENVAILEKKNQLNRYTRSYATTIEKHEEAD